MDKIKKCKTIKDGDTCPKCKRGILLLTSSWYDTLYLQCNKCSKIINN